MSQKTITSAESWATLPTDKWCTGVLPDQPVGNMARHILEARLPVVRTPKREGNSGQASSCSLLLRVPPQTARFTIVPIHPATALCTLPLRQRRRLGVRIHHTAHAVRTKSSPKTVVDTSFV